MAKSAVEINKGSEKDFKTESLVTDEMNAEVIAFFQTLVPSLSGSFDIKKSYQQLSGYLVKYGRLLYSAISTTMYNVLSRYRESQDNICSSIISNIESLITYSDTDNSENKDTVKKALIKLWDHVNLASQQYVNLKQTDDEYNAKFDANFNKYKEELTKDMNSQLLTLVSIFTALAFLVFGSISSLDNVFSVSGIPILKVMLTGIIWGLCILNLVFVFLYCVSKMTHLKIMTSAGDNASVFKRYPLVCWVNFLLISLLVICSWFYFLQSNEIDSWCSLVTNGTGKFCLFAVSIILFVLIVFVFGSLLFKLTGLGGKEDKYKFSWKSFITIISVWGLVMSIVSLVIK